MKNPSGIHIPSIKHGEKWSYEETCMAMSIYCKIPFAHSNKTTPEIIQFAHLLNRSAGSLYTKLCNLGSHDPQMIEKGIKGLGHGSSLEDKVWNDFNDNPEDFIQRTEQMLAQLQGKTLGESVHIEDSLNLHDGEERERIVRQRVGQEFFRGTVLSSYNFHCCISGVADKKLLDACHIVEWKEDKKNRLNPTNGICLNPFFHRAYDQLLIGISPDYIIAVSDDLIENAASSDFRDYLKGLVGRTIILPDRFLPNKDFLDARFCAFCKNT